MRIWILIPGTSNESEIPAFYLGVKIFMKILGSLINYNLSGVLLLLACKSDNFSDETCLIMR